MITEKKKKKRCSTSQVTQVYERFNESKQIVTMYINFKQELTLTAFYGMITN